jgi:hypothetical protein
MHVPIGHNARMAEMTRALIPVLALVVGGTTACSDRSSPVDRPPDVSIIPVPADAGSRYPHLAASPGMRPILSWLQPAAGDVFELRFSEWEGERWTPSRRVASGKDWFVNWADFPSVVPVTGDVRAAHWLQQKPGNVYSYDVRIAVSVDAGRTWSDPVSPHDDGTPTEHGFVTLYPAQDALHAVWLDGRHTTGEHEHSGGSGGAMTLRGASIARNGSVIGSDSEIDSRVCDCCQTDVAITHEGPVAVYRDRGPGEVRDIAVVRHFDGAWSAPIHVHEDGWRIDACPVNGPAIDAHGSDVVVAWFTAPDRPRVRVAFSSDGGRSFGPPVEVASDRVAGRVDVVMLDDARAIVSWLSEGPSGAEIRAQAFTGWGVAGPATVIARTSVARSSGFPQMVRAGDGLLFAWTESGDPPRVRTAHARLP